VYGWFASFTAQQKSPSHTTPSVISLIDQSYYCCKN